MNTSKNDDAARDRVIALITEARLEGVHVPESGRQSPDIRIRDSDEVILVEVKTKYDAKGAIEAMHALIAKAGTVTIAEVLESRRNLANVLHSAKNQLKAHDKSDRALKVAWVECASWDAVSQLDDWIDTLYGTAYVVDETRVVERNTGSIFDHIAVNLEAVQCDYFYESAFFKYQHDIDGVLIEVEGSRFLFVNDFSANGERLHRTRFANEIATRVVDARRNPLSADRLLADCDGDRGDVDKTLKYVAQKYDLGRARLIPMRRYRSVARITSR